MVLSYILISIYLVSLFFLVHSLFASGLDRFLFLPLGLSAFGFPLFLLFYYVVSRVLLRSVSKKFQHSVLYPSTLKPYFSIEFFRKQTTRLPLQAELDYAYSKRLYRLYLGRFSLYSAMIL